MDLTKLTIFAMATKRLGWLAKRQEVLAQNIANSDTPRYVPNDLAPQQFRKYLTMTPTPHVPKAEMRLTSASHIEPLHRPPKFREDDDDDTYEIAPAGNAVILEEQLMAVNETQGAFRLATNLYEKHVRMIKAAIGRDRG